MVVRSVDYHCEENAKEHRTSDYDMAILENKLIVRRGQQFKITVEFDRIYEEKADKISLTFDIGECRSLQIEFLKLYSCYIIWYGYGTPPNSDAQWGLFLADNLRSVLCNS